MESVNQNPQKEDIILNSNIVAQLQLMFKNNKFVIDISQKTTYGWSTFYILYFKMLNIINQGNVSQNHSEIHLSPDRLAVTKKKNKSAGEDVQQRDPLHTVHRNIN